MYKFLLKFCNVQCFDSGVTCETALIWTFSIAAVYETHENESNLLLKRHVVFLYTLTMKKILLYISEEPYMFCTLKPTRHVLVHFNKNVNL